MPSSVQLRQSGTLKSRLNMIEMVNGGGSKVFNFPGLATGSRGTAVISNPTECLELMKKWEEAALPALLDTAGLLSLLTSTPWEFPFHVRVCLRVERLSVNTALKTNKSQHVSTCCRCSLVWSFRPDLRSLKETEFSAACLRSKPQLPKLAKLQSHRHGPCEGPGERRCGIDETSPFLSDWWRPGVVHIAEDEMAEDARAQGLTQNSCDSILSGIRDGRHAWQMLQLLRTMVAESLAKVLEPMGFAPGRTSQSLSQNISGCVSCLGKVESLSTLTCFILVSRPGLARCVKQMQAGSDGLLSEFNSSHCFGIFGYAWPFVPTQWWRFASMNKNRKERNPRTFGQLHRISNAPCAHVQIHWSTDKNCANKALHFSSMVLPLPVICASLGGPDPRKSALIQSPKIISENGDRDGFGGLVCGTLGTLSESDDKACVHGAPVLVQKALQVLHQNNTLSDGVKLTMPSHGVRRADSLCTTLVRILAVEFNRGHQNIAKRRKAQIWRNVRYEPFAWWELSQWACQGP